MIRRSARLLALTTAAALAACGGGGGTADDGMVLALTASNHVAAAQAALATGLQFEESGDLIAGAQVQHADDASLLRWSLAALRRAGTTWPAVGGTLATGVVITSSASCDNAGGSYVLAIDDANNDNRLNAGDTFTFTFTNCTLDGDTANGKVAIRVQALTGSLDTPVHDGRFTMTMTALALTGASGSYTGDGALDVSLASTATNTGSSRVASTSFTSTGRFANVQSVRTIRNFTVDESHVPEGAGQRRTIRFDGTVSSSSLENRSISVATPQAFVVAASSRYPGQGQAMVTGARGTAVRVTALDATSVRIELDADGDGSYEQTSTRAWSELL